MSQKPSGIAGSPKHGRTPPVKLTGSVPGANPAEPFTGPWTENRNNVSYLLTVPELVKQWMALGITEQYTRLLDIYKIGVPNFAGAPPGVDLHQFDSEIDVTAFPTLLSLQDAVETYLKARVEAKNKAESNIGQGTAQPPPPSGKVPDISPEVVESIRQDFEEFKSKIAKKLIELIPDDGKDWGARGQLMDLAVGSNDLQALYEENGHADHWCAKLNDWKWKNEQLLVELRKRGSAAKAMTPAEQPKSNGKAAADTSEVSATKAKYTGNEPLDSEEAIRALFEIEMTYTDKKTGKKDKRKYLQAAGAVLIFRLRHREHGCIETQLVQFGLGEWAIFEAKILLDGRQVSSGHALITVKDAERARGRYLQMGETHAVRRALANFGIGSEELIEDDEEDAAIMDGRSIETGDQNVSQ